MKHIEEMKTLIDAATVDIAAALHSAEATELSAAIGHLDDAILNIRSAVDLLELEDLHE